jgi:hypothetical protein
LAACDVKLLAKSTAKWKFVKWNNRSRNRRRTVTVGNVTAAQAIFEPARRGKKH